MRRIHRHNTKRLGARGGRRGPYFPFYLPVLNGPRTSEPISHLQSTAVGGIERGLPPKVQDTERAPAGAGGSLSGRG